MLGWTGENVRHAAEMVRQGRNPAARVYESIGSEFFLAPSPGWLNLGLWDGAGSEDQAEAACRRLVATLASALPAGGVIVDAGNGLGVQDGLINELVRPRRLVAVNITEWQLAAGRRRLAAAGAAPVVGDAARLPIAGGAADGIISVEAAFHFSSRRAFFEQCYRVLRPGGVVTMFRYRDPALAADARRAGVRADPAAGVRATPDRGDDRGADRRGGDRGGPG